MDLTLDGRSDDETNGHDVPGGEANPIVVNVPCRPEFLPIIRLTASAVASHLDFDVEAVDDIRLAVDELCTMCAAATLDGRITVTYLWDQDCVEVRCVVTGSSGKTGGSESDPLAGMILSALVDEYEIEAGSGGDRRGRLRKARARK